MKWARDEKREFFNRPEWRAAAPLGGFFIDWKYHGVSTLAIVWDSRLFHNPFSRGISRRRGTSSWGRVFPPRDNPPSSSSSSSSFAKSLIRVVPLGSSPSPPSPCDRDECRTPIDDVYLYDITGTHFPHWWESMTMRKTEVSHQDEDNVPSHQ